MFLSGKYSARCARGEFFVCSFEITVKKVALYSVTIISKEERERGLICLSNNRWLPHAMVARLGEREVYWFIRLGRTADRY